MRDFTSAGDPSQLHVQTWPSGQGSRFVAGSAARISAFLLLVRLCLRLAFVLVPVLAGVQPAFGDRPTPPQFDPYANPVWPSDGATIKPTATLRWERVLLAESLRIKLGQNYDDTIALPGDATEYKLTRQQQLRLARRTVMWTVEACDRGTASTSQSCYRTPDYWSRTACPKVRTVTFAPLPGPLLATPVRPLKPATAVAWPAMADAAAYVYCLEPVEIDACASLQPLNERRTSGGEPRLPINVGIWGAYAKKGRARLFVAWCAQGGGGASLRFCSAWSKPVILKFARVRPPRPQSPEDGVSVRFESFQPSWSPPDPLPSTIWICVAKTPTGSCLVSFGIGASTTTHIRASRFVQAVERSPKISKAAMLGQTFYWRLWSCALSNAPDTCTDETSPPRRVTFGAPAAPDSGPIQINRITAWQKGYEISIKNARTALGTQGNPGIRVSENYEKLAASAVTVMPTGTILVESRRTGSFEVRIHIDSRSIVSAAHTYTAPGPGKPGSLLDVEDAPVADRPDLGGGLRR